MDEQMRLLHLVIMRHFSTAIFSETKSTPTVFFFILENVSLRVEQKDAVSNNFVLNTETLIILLTGLATWAIFTSGSRFHCSQAKPIKNF